ncbi:MULTISPECIES: hypothetical protein [unclassified Frankia]|uniref:hypothetical protein n=1 Tax=unclassified Frankia TaxID=2632575 RepID=UPI000460C2E7|nr:MULTISPECIES: hypothetical protein [unclassified Frankia]KDA44731.1 hypothetical protein BMG523Draft_00251 [Frankia sp. BMG5.23]KEZ36413.1 hypothetical protein CEDDRAFT_02269 [Frankia sp. CeD]ORT54232.1 hypothetical protein KBI5_04965 [Frankia sp. KB5]
MTERSPGSGPGEHRPSPADGAAPEGAPLGGPGGAPAGGGGTSANREEPTGGGSTPGAAPTAGRGGGGLDGDSDGSATTAGGDAPRPSPRSQKADDAAFFELIARFDEEPESHRWPAAEDLDDTRRPTVIILRPPFEPAAPPVSEDRTEPGLDQLPFPSAGGEGGRRGRGGTEDLVVDLGDLSGSGQLPEGLDDPDLDPDPDPDGEHYEPPPPPPLPRIRPVTRWALGSIALGVMFLVVPDLIDFNQSRTQNVAGVLLILGGVGTLVARMGDRPPTDFDGPDDGAVV